MFRDGAARLLVFRLGRERFAVELASVEEVMDLPAMHPVPDAPPSVLGIAAIRGALVTIYDPRSLLNVGGRADGVLLLFARDERRAGFAVDDVQDAITVEARELLAVPGNQSSDGMLAGVVRRGAELIAVLNADALLAVAAVSVLTGEGPGEIA